NKQGGIRGRPIHFVFHDDQTSPQVSLQLLNAIVANHPAIVLGSSLAASCQATLPIVNASGPVEYCLSPALHPARGSFVFASSVSTRDCMIAFIRYFRERGLKRLGAITATDQGGQDADGNIAAALDLPENKNAGMSIVAHEHFSFGDISVRAQLARIKAADPQAVLLWGTGTSFATLLRGVSEVGLDVPFGTSNAVMIYAQLKQYASFLPKELLFPGLPFLAQEAPTKRARDVQRQFFDAFAAVNVRPDFIYSTAWDPAVIAISALRALGTNATADQVRNYIANLHDFTGIAGDYDFRTGQTGLSEKNVMIMRWDAGKETWVAASRLGGLPLR
ncbi:MAG TPA: ABC transporter substrate-binding protein, partial [Candidatus Binatia bacterium]|nr:ABC transporter substrate-binding protein [Candidatus Binatia bacterium]